MRDEKGRFVKGYDPDRYVFTKEDCKAGFQSLCDRMSGAGSLYQRAQAVRFLYWRDSVRFSNPDLVPQKAIGAHQRKPRGRSR